MSASPNGSVGASDISNPSFPNPNVQRNRVPGRAELLNLQAFSESNKRIAHVLDEEIEHLKGSYNAIHARYIQLQIEMEATQSELHTAKDLLVTVRKQRTALQAEQDGLRALMHPIRRCPDEILREIFELTQIDSFEIKRSVLISSVCQRWRDVALDTSMLWEAITMRLEKSQQSQEFLRAHILPRVKRRPATVNVGVISSKHLDALTRCGLDDISVIKKLTLAFSSKPGEIQHLLGPHFKPPTGTLQTLCIRINASDAVAHALPHADAPEVDILRFVAKFPPFMKLTTRGIPTVVFPIAVTNPDIIELELFDTMGTDIIGLLQCLPRLKSINIWSGELAVGDGQVARSFPSVEKVVSFGRSGEAWMEKVIFPKIKSLTYYSRPTDAFLNFLSRHKSITDLGNLIWSGMITKYMTVAPQLECLQVMAPFERVYSRLDGSQEMPFPALKSITICDRRAPHNLTTKQFDALVRARCLPVRHPKSQAQQQSYNISLVAVRNSVTAESVHEWHESELYKESTKVIDDRDPNKVHLSWPQWE